MESARSEWQPLHTWNGTAHTSDINPVIIVHYINISSHSPICPPDSNQNVTSPLSTQPPPSRLVPALPNLTARYKSLAQPALLSPQRLRQLLRSKHPLLLVLIQFSDRLHVQDASQPGIVFGLRLRATPALPSNSQTLRLHHRSSSGTPPISTTSPAKIVYSRNSFHDTLEALLRKSPTGGKEAHDRRAY